MCDNMKLPTMLIIYNKKDYYKMSQPERISLASKCSMWLERGDFFGSKKLNKFGMYRANMYAIQNSLYSLFKALSKTGIPVYIQRTIGKEKNKYICLSTVIYDKESLSHLLDCLV